MCRKVLENVTENAQGFFLKGNEPNPMEMEILVAPCVCGKTWWAKVSNGVYWVQADKEENRNVNDDIRKAFADDVAAPPALLLAALR